MEPTMKTTSQIDNERQHGMATANHRIHSVSINGGFLDGAEFEFKNGLNCIIGARGAGKTTLLEFVRYALDTIPGGKNSIERRRIESLVEKNLGGGRLQVTIETRDGLTYSISRSAGEEPIVLGNDGKPVGIRLKSSGVFHADIYSQNEIETIADDTSAQLSLLDNFEAELIAELGTQIHQLRTELQSNAHHVLSVQRQVDGLTEEVATLSGVEQQLQDFVISDQDGSEVVNRAHAAKSLRDREQRTVTAVRESLQVVSQTIAPARERAERLSNLLFDEEILTGENASIIETVGSYVEQCRDTVERLAEEAANHVAGTLAEIATLTRTLHNTHAEQELEFRELLDKHRHAQSQAAQRMQLERRRNDLLMKQRECQQLQSELTALRTHRMESLVRMRELQDQRFAVREAIVHRINAQLSPVIRISIVQGANVAQYQRMLEEVLRSARVRHLVVAQKLAETFWPVKLACVIHDRDTASLVKHGELNSEQAEKVLSALSQPEVAFQLETVDLFDLPRIELQDGEAYKDSLSLSTGQKCTTILPILLLDSDNPLLVDQPEDNLDNRFIFETVVESICKVKHHRQLIFVTHNPNIPVLANAERVFVLDSDGTASRQTNVGTVDEVKSDIVTLLEGGEDAFKARKLRYAY
jgi:ABC-type lipoprotein export system ATPase subunit